VLNQRPRVKAREKKVKVKAGGKVRTTKVETTKVEATKVKERGEMLELMQLSIRRLLGSLRRKVRLTFLAVLLAWTVGPMFI
jgi:hypothetical protein